jgi:hypothetical protein
MPCARLLCSSRYDNSSYGHTAAIRQSSRQPSAHLTRVSQTDLRWTSGREFGMQSDNSAIDELGYDVDGPRVDTIGAFDIPVVVPEHVPLHPRHVKGRRVRRLNRSRRQHGVNDGVME